MARYYSTLDNSTVASLEASPNLHLRVPFVGNGSSLKAAALAARDALDANLRPQIDTVNNNGTLGVVVPRDAMTRGATTITVPNLYKNPSAVYPADPKVRPTADITIANSTPVSPVDSIVIPNDLYDNAVSAATALVQGTGVYERLGNDANKTLRSLWHDANLTYFAWDTFTPEAPFNPANSFDAQKIDAGVSTTVKVMWGTPHPYDIANATAHWLIVVETVDEIGPHIGGGVTEASGNGTSAPNTLTGAVPIPTGLQGGWRYRVHSEVYFKYAATGAVGPRIVTVTYQDVN